MTPKEKALELINSFLAYVDWNNIQSDATNRAWAGRNAKQCALIAVDELIHSHSQDTTDNQFYFWVEVKQEIEKL